jgi:hypothetical protein
MFERYSRIRGVAKMFALRLETSQSAIDWYLRQFVRQPEHVACAAVLMAAYILGIMLKDERSVSEVIAERSGNAPQVVDGIVNNILHMVARDEEATVFELAAELLEKPGAREKLNPRT